MTFASASRRSRRKAPQLARATPCPDVSDAVDFWADVEALDNKIDAEPAGDYSRPGVDERRAGCAGGATR